MAAKSPASKKTKAASSLKSPKTTKADKVSKQVTKPPPPKETTSKEELLKTGLNPTLVKKAVEALIKHHESMNADKLSLLGNDQSIQVQFTLCRTPGNASPKPIRIVIPHPLFQVKSEGTNKQIASGNIEEAEVCLIVKEESKPWCQEMIERFPEHMGCVKKVLGLQSLRTKHARYDQRRTLLQKYNVFMADDRILPMLSKSLGTDFYKAKKLPIPITLTRKEALPFAIQKALSATYMTLSKGTCIMVRAGNTSMSPIQLTENIVKIAEDAVPKMPLKWANIQNIAVKTPESVALPIYNKTPQVLMEIAAKAGVVQTIEEPPVKETIETSTAVVKTNNESEKKRETTSPLLRALKRQKQEENTKKSNKDGSSAKVTQKEETTSKAKKRRSLSEDTSSSKKAESSVKKTKVSKDKIEDDTPPPKVNKKADAPDTKSKKGKKDAEAAASKSPDTISKKGKKDEETAASKSPDAKSQKGQKDLEAASSSADPKSKKGKKEAETAASESKKSFIAAKKYNGSKKGYVFRMGKEGLGYYADVKPVVDKMAMDALLRAASKGKSRQADRHAGPKRNKSKGGRRF